MLMNYGTGSPWASAMSRTPRRDWAPPPMGQEDMWSTEERPDTRRRSTSVALLSCENGGEEDLPAGFVTPLRVTSTVMGRQREVLLGFRTPQHPCSGMGSNNWGGASPLLARNIPKESLDNKYLRLTTLRTRDEIFPMADQVELHRLAAAATPGGESRHMGGNWLFSKLSWKRKKAPEVISLGAGRGKRSGWLARRDYRTRWPQGWC